MKVSLISDTYKKKLLFVNHAISTRSQLPILLNFLIEAREGKLNISATDLEIGIIVEIPAKTEEEGWLRYQQKHRRVGGNDPFGKITLETTSEGLVMVSEKEENTFQTARQTNSQNYMRQRTTVNDPEEDLIGSDFSKVVFAASPDSERPALSGS